MSTLIQQNHYAYVDESGDPSIELNKNGVSQLYVVCAIIITESEKINLIEHAERVRKQYFQTGEMKSSSVGSNIKRRIAILSSLLESGIKFCALISDKKDIYPNSGLKHKRTFIKYFHNRLYQHLYRAYSTLYVYSDEHGNREFMKGFAKYLAKRYKNDLFDHEIINFIDSKNYPLVQAADMIAGSLSRYHSGKDTNQDIIKLLSNSAIIVERWPPRRIDEDVLEGLTDEERFDHFVAQQSIILARDFIFQNANTSDQLVTSQVDALQYLLYKYEMDPTQYTFAQEINRHVNLNREEQLTERALRTEVIARLRDNGVVIASSNRGYKIPSCHSDVLDFVSHVEGQTIPYLKRLSRARNHLLLASDGAYEIINQEAFPELFKCIYSLNE